jgi:hypothetical protein
MSDQTRHCGDPRIGLMTVPSVDAVAVTCC